MTPAYLIVVAFSAFSAPPPVPTPPFQTPSMQVCQQLGQAYVRLGGVEHIRYSCLQLGDDK